MKPHFVKLINKMRFYSEAGLTSECGSDRQSYGAFPDDDPTAGVKESLAKLREKGIIEKNKWKLNLCNGRSTTIFGNASYIR
jgi:hypothetical protein